MDKKTQTYLRNHERIKTRAIASIMRKQSGLFASMLRDKDGQKSYEDVINRFLYETEGQIPEYLVTVLPKIMTTVAKPEIERYSELLPEGYGLSFDVDTSPASNYLRDMRDLMLSQRQGSIGKTTRDELRRIMADGFDAGLSYSQIADLIEDTDPFVFSRTRAELIATNEIGRAAGFANHEPAMELSREGYGMVKKWKTSHDEKVRKTHAANEAAGWINIDEPFPGTGDQYGPSTNDIRCRCTSTTRIVTAKTASGKRLSLKE